MASVFAYLKYLDTQEKRYYNHNKTLSIEFRSNASKGQKINTVPIKGVRSVIQVMADANPFYLYNTSEVWP